MMNRSDDLDGDQDQSAEVEARTRMSNGSGSGKDSVVLETPPLQLKYLFVWMFCVAVWLGIAKTAFNNLNFANLHEYGLFGTLALSGLGILKGTEIAGLIMFFALWRHRGHWFGYPGENFLVVLGISSGITLGVAFFEPRLFLGYTTILLWGWALLTKVLVAFPLLITAIFKTNILRWRMLMEIMVVLMIAATIVVSLFHYRFVLSIQPLGMGIIEADGLIGWTLLVLWPIWLVTAVIDLSERPRLPWTHWLGSLFLGMTLTATMTCLLIEVSQIRR